MAYPAELVTRAEHIHIEEKRIASKEPDGSLEGLCRLQHQRIQKFLEQDHSDELLRAVQQQIEKSLEVVRRAIETYSLGHLCISYNGGKDCLVLLVIYLSAIYANYIAEQEVESRTTARRLPLKLRSIYILPPHQFPEVDAFVQTSATHYQLDLTSSSKPMKAAFEEYLQEHKDVQAIFVGTRRTDPHGGNLKHFDPTDRGWPSFMRIHPVIDWHYREIWAFIRHLEIPYCSLYDKGYTSLGGTNDTFPNPKLRSRSIAAASTAVGDFKPAYELTEDDEERLGRDST